MKAGPGARLGDIGLEVSLFGGMLSGSTWDFIRFCFLNWLGLGTGFILCAYNFFFFDLHRVFIFINLKTFFFFFTGHNEIGLRMDSAVMRRTS